MKCLLINPFYDVQGRKYIDVELDGKQQRIKVPFRYNRVMCEVVGITPIQVLPKGSVLNISYKKVVWEGVTHLVLERIELVS